MKLHFVTLGCKVNQSETQSLQALLIEGGHRLCTAEEKADAVIINTCTVTAESGRKSRQAIRRAKGNHPGAIVAVCGCFSELSPEEVEALGVDLVWGSKNRRGFVSALEQLFQGKRPELPMDELQTFEMLPAGGLEGRTRALLKVQDGCDNFCTYCIVPYARGPVRSLPLDTAAKQAKALEAEGFREIVLTGIELSAYGKDLTENEGLGELVEEICKALPDTRIRLGSLEPRTITENFVRRLRHFQNLCPHFHLSLQSGSDTVLARMGRRYDTAWYSRSLALLRHAFPNCAVTTDLIVGFPGESAGEYQESLSFLKSCAFSAVHVFPYSARAGTKAAKMPGQIAKAEKTRRANEARQLAAALTHTWLSSQVGLVQPVLFEQEKDGLLSGHTPNYCAVSVPGTGLENQIRPVLLQAVSGDRLLGEITGD